VNHLLIRGGGLGDAVLTLPVLARIRAIHPEDTIDVLGSPFMCDMARLSGLSDTVHSFDDHGFHTLAADGNPSPFLREFLSRYSTIYWFSTLPASGRRAFANAAGVADCRVLDPRPREELKWHVTTHLLTILGDNPDGMTPQLPTMEGQCGDTTPRRGLVIHPGSGGLAKTWPIERFAAVARNVGGPVTMIVGPAERDRHIDLTVLARVCAIVEPPTVADLYTVLRSAMCYLGNDSGVSHLAAYAGTPATVMFGPTDPRIWRPLGDTVRVLSSHDGTMHGIGVHEVLEALTCSGDGQFQRPNDADSLE
jgi:heptosyltransferase III